MVHVLMLKHVEPDVLGLLPYFLDEKDPRPAREQFDERYAHGGGWRPMQGWKLLDNMRIQYPGDKPLDPIAVVRMRDEMITFYPHAFVLIISRDDKPEIARMD